jgi:adenylate cyclase
MVLDYSYRLRGSMSSWSARDGVPSDSMNVVLIDVDNETYRLLGSEGWPYPRGKVWSNIIRNLTDAEAKVIVFDIEFDSRDAYTAKILSVFNNTLPDGFLDGDSMLAESILYAKENGTAVVMPSTIKVEPSSQPPQHLVVSNSHIRRADPDHGLVDVFDDGDGFTRRYSIFNAMVHEADIWHLSLGMKAVKHYLEIPDSVNLRYDEETSSFSYGPLTIPSYGYYNQFILNNIYGPPSHAKIGTSDAWKTFPRYPLSSVIDTEEFDLDEFEEDTDWMSKFNPFSSFNLMMQTIDPDYEIPESPFKDKICMIGVSVEVFHDYKKTAFFNYLGVPTLMPGFEFHANAVQTLLDQNFIKVYGGTLETTRQSFLPMALLILGLCLIAFLFLSIFDPLMGGIGVIIEIFIFVSMAIGAFTQDYLWLIKLISGNSNKINVPGFGESLVIPVIAPIAGILGTYGINMLYKFILEQKDKRFLKNTFGNYISPELIDQMYESKQAPELGGEEGFRTAYFTDIQGFSTFSEKLTPTRLVDLLNEYLSAMTDILIDNNGTLDKYEGDAIIAFFGAPIHMEDHAYKACLTAMQMQNKLIELREKWTSENEKWPDIVHDMRMRIGVASGRMVTGNMGSKMRMNYTMMGDSVNTAARLESSAKQYGVYTQTISQTHDETPDAFLWRRLDKVIVMGKKEPIETYELLNFIEDATDQEKQLVQKFHEALEIYNSQDWDRAIQAFGKANKLEDHFVGRKTTPCLVYIERCEIFKENPPGNDWDGSWTLTSK